MHSRTRMCQRSRRTDTPYVNQLHNIENREHDPARKDANLPRKNRADDPKQFIEEWDAAQTIVQMEFEERRWMLWIYAHFGDDESECPYHKADTNPRQPPCPRM